MKALALIIALCASLSLASCGGDDSDTSGSTATTADQANSDAGESASEDAGGPESKTPKKAKPVVEIPEEPPPTELVVRDIEEGDGEEVKDGVVIYVDYVGVFYKDGKEAESTWDNTAPEEFTMDSGELIKGWEEGIEGMRVGGRRELIVPSNLAFKTGDLVYVVDLRGIK